MIPMEPINEKEREKERGLKTKGPQQNVGGFVIVDLETESETEMSLGPILLSIVFVHQKRTYEDLKKETKTLNLLNDFV